MEIEFKGQFDKSQYRRAVMLAYQPSLKKTWFRIAIFVLLAGLYTAFIATLVRTDEASTWDLFRVLRHLFTLLLLAYFVFYPFINPYLAANKLWNDPVTRRAISGKVSEQGVMVSPSPEYIDWDIFIKLRKRVDMAVLLTADNNFLALPRSFFNSDHDWAYLQKYLDRYVREAV
jgi:hypothetical protein